MKVLPLTKSCLLLGFIALLSSCDDNPHISTPQLTMDNKDTNNIATQNEVKSEDSILVQFVTDSSERNSLNHERKKIDSLDQSKLSNKVAVEKINGTFQLYKYIPTDVSNKKLDTSEMLVIQNKRLSKYKGRDLLYTSDLRKKVKATRELYYLIKFEERYARVIEDGKILILNVKGYDGAMEYYRRVDGDVSSQGLPERSH